MSNQVEYYFSNGLLKNSKGEVVENQKISEYIDIIWPEVKAYLIKKWEYKRPQKKGLFLNFYPDDKIISNREMFLGGYIVQLDNLRPLHITVSISFKINTKYVLLAGPHKIKYDFSQYASNIEAAIKRNNTINEFL